MKKRFISYRQHDSMDCGPTCLKMIAEFYGKCYSLQTLRDNCHITRAGVSMLGVSDAAESIGFKANGVRLTWTQLRKDIPLPCIVHWNQNHFVVVYDVDKKGNVTVADPASGLLKYHTDEFVKFWAQPEGANRYGLALILEPTYAFYMKEGETDHKFGLLHVLQYIMPYRAYIVQIILAMITSAVISLLLTFITQSVVDAGTSNGNLSIVIVLLVAQLMLTIGGMINNYIRSFLMLHTTSRVSIALISDFLCKLMKLPIAFFDGKLVGDIMQRIGDYNRIQSFLSGYLLSVVISAVSLLIYSIVMAGYNSSIFLVFILGSFLYFGWVFFFMKRRRELDNMRFRYTSIGQSHIVQMISGMLDIKLNNCENQKLCIWENNESELFKVNTTSLSLGQMQEVGGAFIDSIKNILISFIAAKSVIYGNMSLGMMMALQYIMGQINAPILQFIGFAQSAQDASISLDRLWEIHMLKDEEPEDESRINKIPKNANIVLQNVDFQYDGPNSNKVLDDVSLVIPYGKVTAVVGSSGSGKTTMLKIMLGFYQPTSGVVCLNETPLRNYSERCWRKECGSVMQEGFIFSDTIAGNIAISDEHMDMSRVRNAAEISNIKEWVDGLPLGYNTKIGADGIGLSTGQKQRVLIARAAYKNAQYLFLDEATNSLDAKNERIIKDNLDRLFYGKTVVVVAHRLSTVRNADNIIVLEQGHIIEQGTHKQLIANRGKYYDLVKNQFEEG